MLGYCRMGLILLCVPLSSTGHQTQYFLADLVGIIIDESLA